VVKSRAEPLYIDPDSPFVREVLDLAGRDTPTTVCYGTDGGMLTELSNMVVIGPGDIAQAHTWDEFIDLEQLELGTDLYARMIEEWCG
jgi:acetylornithine deacetylase